MPILEHLEELRQRLFKIMWTVLPLFLFYVTFSIRLAEFQGILIPYPWPDFYGSISTQVVRALMDSLLPSYVQRYQLHPGEAIIVQFKVAFFLAILTGMPMIVYQLSRFVTPGLYPMERQTIARITIPATLLFGLGVLFAYFWILPFTFNFLYGVGLSMGLTPVVGPSQFFDVALLFFVGLGLAFQIPIIMWGLTAIGIVDPAVWKKYWRVALVAFFFFGAVITPDGSGVTMMLVAVPMTFLYGAGYVLSKRKWRVREGPREGQRERKSNFAVWSIVVVLILALAGGVVYYNRGLFAPPSGGSQVVLTSGTIDLRIPAFVLYPPNALDPDVSTGVLLHVTNDTIVSLQWSAGAADGRRVAFVSNISENGPISTGEDASTMAVIPAIWDLKDARLLTLMITDDRPRAYVLELAVEYELLLETVFADGNRNGVWDTGEAAREELLIVRYTPRPGQAALVDLEESGVPAPAPEQLSQASKGIFRSTGPTWRLETSISEMGTSDTVFEYTMLVSHPGLDEYGVDVFLTRGFQWSEDEDLEVWVTGEAPAHFVYLWHLDLRFGAIFPVLQPP